MKVTFIIYSDLECLLEKMHSCQDNPEKSYTKKKKKHTSSGYSLFTNCSCLFFNCSSDSTKIKLDSQTSVLKYINLILLILCLH